MKNKFRLKLQAAFLSLILVLGVSFSLLPTTGCTPSTAAIAADGNAVATALLSIAALEQPLNPTLAQQLTTAAGALKQATANWTTGSPTADINSAAVAVEAVLAIIPVTAGFAPLVAVAVAALDVVLANLPHQTPVSMEAVENTSNPYHTPAHKYHLSRSPLHPTWNGAFKHAWNSKAKALGYNSVLLP